MKASGVEAGECVCVCVCVCVWMCVYVGVCMCEWCSVHTMLGNEEEHNHHPTLNYTHKETTQINTEIDRQCQRNGHTVSTQLYSTSIPLSAGPGIWKQVSLVHIARGPHHSPPHPPRALCGVQLPHHHTTLITTPQCPENGGGRG